MDYMDYKDRIISDHRIMLGKPVIKGTRITVELIMRKMSEGASVTDLIMMYPHLEVNDVFSALSYVSEVLATEEVL